MPTLKTHGHDSGMVDHFDDDQYCCLQAQMLALKRKAQWHLTTYLSSKENRDFIFIIWWADHYHKKHISGLGKEHMVR
jgi:hypothetical protein